MYTVYEVVEMAGTKSGLAKQRAAKRTFHKPQPTIESTHPPYALLEQGNQRVVFNRKDVDVPIDQTRIIRRDDYPTTLGQTIRDGYYYLMGGQAPSHFIINNNGSVIASTITESELPEPVRTALRL